MQRTFIILLLIIISVSLSAKAQDVKSIDKFNGIEVSGKIILQIERKPEYTIKINYKDVDSSCFSQQIEDGILTLQLQSGYKCKGEITVVLGCPTLSLLVATGKADVSTANILTGDSLKLEVRGNARASVDMDIKYLIASLSGGGIFNGEGYALTQSIKATTSSIFSGFELEGEKIVVQALSNSLAKVNASEELQATSGGGGHIIYKGDPKKEKLDPMSNGKIEKAEN